MPAWISSEWLKNNHTARIAFLISDLIDFIELAPEDVPNHEYETIRECILGTARKLLREYKDKS